MTARDWIDAAEASARTVFGDQPHHRIDPAEFAKGSCRKCGVYTCELIVSPPLPSYPLAFLTDRCNALRVILRRQSQDPFAVYSAFRLIAHGGASALIFAWSSDPPIRCVCVHKTPGSGATVPLDA